MVHTLSHIVRPFVRSLVSKHIIKSPPSSPPCACFHRSDRTEQKMVRERSESLEAMIRSVFLRWLVSFVGVYLQHWRKMWGSMSMILIWQFVDIVRLSNDIQRVWDIFKSKSFDSYYKTVCKFTVKNSNRVHTESDYHFKSCDCQKTLIWFKWLWYENALTRNGKCHKNVISLFANFTET